MAGTRIAKCILVVLLGLVGASPVQAATFATGETTQTLPPGVASTLPKTLVIPAGHYIVGGQPYDMRRAGLYRFGSEQRIVHTGSLDNLMSSLAWLMHHGSADDGLTPAQAVATAMKRDLVRSCGYQSEVARYVLQSLGYKARAVALVNETYDSGHTLIEVERAGRWELWDLDYNVKPLTDGGKPTTVVDWVNDTDRSAQVIARDERVLSLPIGDFYGSFLNVPLVSSHVKTWPFHYTDGADRLRMSSISNSYIYLTRAEFYSRYYPNQTVTHP